MPADLAIRIMDNGVRFSLMGFYDPGRYDVESVRRLLVGMRAIAMAAVHNDAETVQGACRAL
jgi:hypothetical protein